MVMQPLLVKVSFMNVSKWVIYHIINRMVSFTLLLTIKSVLPQPQPKPVLDFTVLMLLNPFKPQLFTSMQMNQNSFIKQCILLWNTGKSSIKISLSILSDIVDMVTTNKINHHLLNQWCIKLSQKEKIFINCMLKSSSNKELLVRKKLLNSGWVKLNNLKRPMMNLYVKLSIWESGKLKIIIVLLPFPILVKSKEPVFLNKPYKRSESK